MSDYLLPVEPIDSLPEMPWAEKLAYLTFQFHQLEQIECPLEHSLEEGSYIRRIAIPKGTFFIGRIHKLGHVVELLSGSVIHVKEKCRKLVHAPFSMKTSPGDQVCALTLTDITARTVHPAEGCADIEALEKLYFETTQSLCDLGEKVDHRLRKRIYERSSSSDWGSGSSWSGRYSLCRL
jgi:hypothetical protein